jgi:hypothetical protein
VSAKESANSHKRTLGIILEFTFRNRTPVLSSLFVEAKILEGEGFELSVRKSSGGFRVRLGNIVLYYLVVLCPENEGLQGTCLVSGVV